MAGTKYTRKPAKKLTKRQAEMKKINKKIKKTIARNKRNEGIASKALKSTVQKLGTGGVAVASLSPIGTKAKVARIADKAYKVVKNKLKTKAVQNAWKKGGRDGIIKNKLPSSAFEKRLHEALFKATQKKHGTVVAQKLKKKAQAEGAMPKKGKMGIHPSLRGLKSPSNKKSYDRAIKHEKSFQKGKYANQVRVKTIAAIKNNPSAQMAIHKNARRKELLNEYKKIKVKKKYIKKNAPRAAGLGIGVAVGAAYNKKVPYGRKKNGSFSN